MQELKEDILTSEIPEPSKPPVNLLNLLGPDPTPAW